jgi:hypothetical protein
VRFSNSPDAGSAVQSFEVITKLDPNVDPRSFRLGDLKVGEEQGKVAWCLRVLGYW